MAAMPAVFHGTEDEARLLLEAFQHSCCASLRPECAVFCQTVAMGEDQRFLDYALFLHRNRVKFFSEDLDEEEDDV